MEPINQLDPVDIMVEIEPGMSGKAIARLLEKEGVIKSSTVFYLLLRFKEINDLKSGYYRFSTSATPLEIIDKLRQGEEETFKVTIPEGFTLDEILARYSNLSFPEYDREILAEYIDLYLGKLNLDFGFEDKKVDNEIYFPAEGFIVPTTYSFPLSFDEEDIAAALINYFTEKRLPFLKKAAARSEFSAYEILIIASLIEEEGKLESENRIIASVIYNRLEAGMPLQLDATVQYALEERTERVLYSDLEIDSPYNTYGVNACLLYTSPSPRD